MTAKKEDAGTRGAPGKKNQGSSKDKAVKSLIRELAAMLDETGLTQIEVEQHGLKVRVVREGHGASSVMAQTPATAAVSAPASSPPEPAEQPSDAGALLSPMVGTVFVAAEPGAGAFCKVGDTVKKGQTLLIIEAMKVMNPIAAPEAGTIKTILVNDGEPVEFGQPLLVIE